MNDALIVFVKAPRPGAVKTRLAAALGPALAAAVYRRLADVEIRGTAPMRDEYARLFFFAPADAEAELRKWLGPVPLIAQAGSDLGLRMAAAFAHAFDTRAGRVAIVGTDAPWVRRRHVREALDALDAHDVAIGPARDGGYYLLALRAPRAALFTEIPWSTDRVLQATLDRAAALGLAVRTLEVLPDVDTVDDVRREWPRLRPLLGAPLAARVDAILSRGAGGSSP